MTVLVNVRFLRASSRMSSCGMECAGPPLTLPPIKPQIGAISTHDSTLLRSQAGSRPGVMAFSDEHGPPLADIDSGDCRNGCLHSTGRGVPPLPFPSGDDLGHSPRLYIVHTNLQNDHCTNRCPVISFLSRLR